MSKLGYGMLKQPFDYLLIRRSGWFDKRYYLETYPDVRQAGVDPLAHYMKYGWKEGRNPSAKFDTSYYLSQNEDVRQAGLNPLVHYLRYGVFEKRDCLPDNRYPPYSVEEDPRSSQGSLEKQPPPEFWLRDGSKETSPRKAHDTAAILHVFYPEIFEEIAGYLANLEGDFDLYVSVPENMANLAQQVFAAFPDARVLVVENRGRDIAPFLTILNATRGLGYTWLLKLHTKRSPHRMDGDFWRKEVYETLAGSRETVRRVKQRLLNDRQAGIIGPKGHVLNNRLYLGGNAAPINYLAYKAGIGEWEKELTYFVAGTMFWAKPEALRTLADLGLQAGNFEAEPIEPDGAMVHAVERCVGLAAAKDGFKLLEVDRQGEISEPKPDYLYKYAPFPRYGLVSGEKGIKSVVFYSAYQEEYAIEYLRMLAPLQQAGVEIIHGGRAGKADPEKVMAGQAVIFQREFPQNLAVYEQIVKLARQAKKPIIYDLDDLLFALPEGHPEKLLGAYTSSLVPMLLAVVEADLVTVTTPQLREQLLGFNPNIQVLPNTLDERIWNIRPPKAGGTAGEPLTIGYMGSSSHTPDLELITPVLFELLEKYRGKLKIRMWGTEPPPALGAHPAVEWTPAPSNRYTDFVRYFQTQWADIFVAPLRDNVFNQCKSAIKFLEYSALGAPGVYSQVAPYAAVIKHGHNGLLAATPAEWAECLTRLIEDEGLRREMAANAQNTLRGEWLLSGNILKWYTMLDSLPSLAEAEQTVEKQSRRDILQAIAQQQQSQASQNPEMSQLRQQVNALTSQLNAANRELKRNTRGSIRGYTALVRKVFGLRERLKQNWGGLRSQAKSIPGAWRKKARQRLNVTRFGRLVQESGLFNEQWYLEKNPDVATAGVNPLRHYILYGGYEGRDPGPGFSSGGYLGRYPDVLQAGMNPLLHYLRFGRQEGRVAQEATALPAEEPGKAPEAAGEQALQGAVLVQKLVQKMQHKRYLVALSHNSYLKFTGGVQLWAAQEQKTCAREQTSYLHLFPNTFLEYLPPGEGEFLVGMNLDGETLGVASMEALLEALASLEGYSLVDIHIHHLMGFQLKAVQRLLKFGGKRAEFWLHDFFSICPSFHLLRNDREYCGAPAMNSNACGICKYLERRQEQLPALQQLFEENQLRVFAPSNFVLDLWREKFPVKNVTSEIVPLVRLSWGEPARLHKSKRTLRVGFLGYPMEHKGWSSWLKLTEACRGDGRYKFFHFSWAEGTPGNYERVPVTVTPENPNMMLESLKKEDIDVAVLWSMVPETFSFTLHEALAAGCMVLTNPKSGNIQDFLGRFPEHGMVLESDQELIELFRGDELVRRVQQYQANGKPQGELVRD